MLDFIIGYAENFLDWGLILCKVVLAWGITFYLVGFFVLFLLALLAIWRVWLREHLSELHYHGGSTDE